MNKYHAVKTEVDGFVFDSKREARRYRELKLLESAGEIGNLALQPKFDLSVNGEKICSYYADFEYCDLRTGKTVVEDAKGVRTHEYRIKKKLVRAIYGVTIVEV